MLFIQWASFLWVSVWSLIHSWAVGAVKMSKCFSNIKFQMFKWFPVFFLLIAILVCRTWFLKKLRLCRRATTLARCSFVLLFEGVPAYHHCRWPWRCRRTSQVLRTRKTFPFHLDYIDASSLEIVFHQRFMELLHKSAKWCVFFVAVIKIMLLLIIQWTNRLSVACVTANSHLYLDTYL